jgi:lysophospholipase L1-like esterase
VTWLKGVALVALVSIGGMSGGFFAHASADTPAGGKHAPRVFAVGHSWVVGLSSGQQIGYVDQLARDARAIRIDADHSGYTTRRVAHLVESVPRCRARDFAVVQIGLNDVRRYGAAGLPRFRRSLGAILKRLEGCQVVLVQEPGALQYSVKGRPLVGNDRVVHDYRLTSAEVARVHANVTLVRPRLQQRDYLLDGLHPDRSGNLVIYRAVKRTAAWQAFLDAR